jgi:hypothetical protein
VAGGPAAVDPLRDPRLSEDEEHTMRGTQVHPPANPPIDAAALRRSIAALERLLGH